MSNYLIESMLSYGGRIDESCGKKKKKLTESVPIANEYEVATVFWPDAGESVLRVWEDTDGDFWWADEWGASEHEFASLEDAIDDYKFNYSGEFDSIRMTPDYDYLDESLIEAVNHENDEINEIIRRTVGKKNISKADAKALADAGITRDKYGDLVGKNGRRLAKHGRTEVYGPSHTVRTAKPRTNQDGTRTAGFQRKVPEWNFSKNPSRWDVGSRGVENFDNVDLKNYLDKPRNDTPYNINQKIQKSLRPYSDEYKELKDQEEFEKRRLDWSKQELDSHKKQVDYRQADYDNATKELNDFKDSVKAKHDAKKKNESLSLNEGAQHTKFMMKILQAVQEHLDGRYKNINITIDSQASGLVVSDGTHTENYNITLKMAPVYSISNGEAGTIYKFTPVSVTTVSDANQVIADLIRIIKQDFDL